MAKAVRLILSASPLSCSGSAAKPLAICRPPNWINMGEGSCWDWEEGSRRPMDIIAYWEEDDVVEIPVIDLSRSASEQGL